MLVYNDIKSYITFWSSCYISAITQNCFYSRFEVKYGWSNVAKFNEIILSVQRNNYFDSTKYLYIQQNNYLYIQRIIYIFNEIMSYIFNELFIY